MPTPKQQYRAALDRIAKRYASLDDETLRRLIELLQQTRRNVAEQLAANPGGFQAARLTQLRRAIDQEIRVFRSELLASLRQSFTNAHRLGLASVTEPLQAIGEQGAVFSLVPSQLNVALDFSAELVTNISDDLRNTINRQLRRAALAEQSPFEAMQAVTDALGVKASDGVWGLRNRPEVVKGVAARAEAIVRTELTRIYNVANHSQQAESAEVVPGLMKAWVATGDRRTRLSHLRAHRRYRDDPIPINEPFIVGGAELMYPGDPAGPVRETIYCRCTQNTIHPAVGPIGTPLDGLITRELNKRAKKQEAA